MLESGSQHPGSPRDPQALLLYLSSSCLYPPLYTPPVFTLLLKYTPPVFILLLKYTPPVFILLRFYTPPVFILLHLFV